MKELKQKIIRVTNDILNIDEDEIEEKKNTKFENKEKKQSNFSSSSSSLSELFSSLSSSST